MEEEFIYEDPLTEKIYDLRIRTYRVLTSFLRGNAKSKTRGIGEDFNQIREYFLGDDVRLVDWRSSAKVNALVMREYNAEKKYTVLIAVDVSMSQRCGGKNSKLDLTREIASIITAACQFFHDQVAVVLFTDEIERFMPFRKGRFHGIEIIKTLHTYTPRGTRTDIANVLRFIGSLKRKDMIVFIVSDFVDTGYHKDLMVLSRKHECIAIVCEDKYEVQLPTFGFISAVDPETKREVLLDLRVQDSNLNNYLKCYRREKKEALKKCGIRYLFLPSKNDVCVELVILFNKTVRSILPPEWAYE
jgi:uncharacterized protein (DUF58 family)